MRGSPPSGQYCVHSRHTVSWGLDLDEVVGLHQPGGGLGGTGEGQPLGEPEEKRAGGRAREDRGQGRKEQWRESQRGEKPERRAMMEGCKEPKKEKRIKETPWKEGSYHTSIQTTASRKKAAL